MDGTMCVRQWKRDRTLNVMSLGAAVANLQKNGDSREPEDIRADLMGGRELSTPLALIRLAPNR